MDRRALVGLFGGLAGCTFAVCGALVGSPVLTLLAGIAAMVAGAAALSLHASSTSAEAASSSSPAPVMRPERNPEPWSLVDPETGVPDGRFFELAVESHVLAAKRQLWPMSIVLLDVKPWDDLRRTEVMGGFVQLVRQTLRDADVLCRLGPTSFGVILDDTGEAGGVGAAQRVQAASTAEGLSAFSVVAGVASYPAHGLEAVDVLFRARAALARARAEAGRGPGGVTVATADPA